MLDFAVEPAQNLEYKHLLIKLISNQDPAIIPQSYHINDQNWPHILQILYALPKKPWILKPSMLNNGQHIHIFATPHELEHHYSQNNRMGGDHVIQEYITNPHLLKGPQLGHKYSLRLFMILSTHFGAYLYKKGYFNIALNPYDSHNYKNLSAHLTNEHLNLNLNLNQQSYKPNIIQIPTEQYALFKPFYPQIYAQLQSTISQFNLAYPQIFHTTNPHKLALFGCDFLVDSNEKVWLLELNHAPCFPIHLNHPLQESLYKKFWDAFIQCFIMPSRHNKPNDLFDTYEFDRLC